MPAGGRGERSDLDRKSEFNLGSFRDVLLQSDWPGMDRKLQEIRENLQEFNNFRVNLPTDEYFRYALPLA